MYHLPKSEDRISIDLTDEEANELRNFAEALRQMPTEYFKNKALLWTKPDNSALQSETGKTPTFQQMPPSEYFGIPDNSNNTLANDNLSNINFQTVYHGSGAKFERFNTDEYGLSGEGSISFGYGTYLTDSEEIVREYAERQRKRTLNKESVNPYDRGTLEYEMFEDLRSDSFSCITFRNRKVVLGLITFIVLPSPLPLHFFYCPLLS